MPGCDGAYTKEKHVKTHKKRNADTDGDTNGDTFYNKKIRINNPISIKI